MTGVYYLSNLHLLINVFVTPLALNKYKIQKVHSYSETFRIDRFLTASISMEHIPWKSVHIYLSIDECWRSKEKEIHNAILQIFPMGVILGKRLESRQSWQEATKNYPPNDVVLLQANDDHALVCQRLDYFEEFARTFLEIQDLQIAAVTHFPEMRNLVGINPSKSIEKLARHDFVPVRYAIGTQLLRASFLQSWWENGKINDETRIFRPDNPFGQSVSFPETNMMIPKFELFRHMDGYGHIFIHRPLGPLRNLTTLDDFRSVPVIYDRWRTANWPAKVLAFAGKGCDLHTITSDHEDSPSIQKNVALLQSYWAVRIHLREGINILQLNKRNSVVVMSISISLATLTFPILRNVPDWVLGKGISIPKKIHQKITRRKKIKINNWEYLGGFRSLLIKLVGYYKLKHQKLTKIWN